MQALQQSPRSKPVSLGVHRIGYDTHFTHHRFVAAKKKKRLEMAGTALQHQHLFVFRGAVFTAKARRRLKVKRLNVQSVTFKNFQQLLLLYHMKRKRMVTERSRGSGKVSWSASPKDYQSQCFLHISPEIHIQGKIGT